MDYSIQTLCNKNMFIKDVFPTYSQSRYIKIFQFLFKIGYHLALCMKKNTFIPFNDELNNHRDLLFNYVEFIYKDGNLHHDLLKYSIKNINQITINEKKIIEKRILESIILLKKMLNGLFLQFSKDSIDYFITKTITIYSLYITLKK